MDGVGKRVACLPSWQFQVHSEAADNKNEGLRLSATPVFELSLSGYMNLSALSTLGCLSGFRRARASQFDTLSFCWFCVNEEIHAGHGSIFSHALAIAKLYCGLGLSINVFPAPSPQTNNECQAIEMTRAKPAQLSLNKKQRVNAPSQTVNVVCNKGWLHFSPNCGHTWGSYGHRKARFG